MRLDELFLESVLDLPGRLAARVYRNVAASNLLMLLMNSHEEKLRGLIVGRDVYWWDAYNATHGEVASVYDPDIHDMDRIIEYKKHRLAICLVDNAPHIYAGEAPEELARIPSLTRLIARNYPLTVTMKDFEF